jgi:hypothetical protein
MKLKLALAAAVAALSVPSTADAAYTITGYSLNPGNSITGNIQYTPTNLSLNVGIGRLNLTGKDANNASASFLTFCVDIFHTLTVPAQFDFKPTSTLITDATKVSRLTTLVGMSNLLINNASDKATTSAALQLAAWEIVNEKTTNAYSFSTGDFRSSGGNSDGARTLAMTYLNNITTNKWQAPNGTLKLFYSANSQSQVLSAVPEPATWAMMIGGFGLVGGTMRRRRIAGNTVTA